MYVCMHAWATGWRVGKLVPYEEGGVCGGRFLKVRSMLAQEVWPGNCWRQGQGTARALCRRSRGLEGATKYRVADGMGNGVVVVLGGFGGRGEGAA